MASMIEIICNCGCGRKKMVRVADVKRGWGKYYSKSCKAKEQERRTGQYKNYKNGGFKDKRSREETEWEMETDIYEDMHPFSSEGLGQD